MSIKDLNNRMDRLMQRGVDPRRPPFTGCRELTASEYAAELEAERQREAIEGPRHYSGTPVFTGMTLVVPDDSPHVNTRTSAARSG